MFCIYSSDFPNIRFLLKTRTYLAKLVVLTYFASNLDSVKLLSHEAVTRISLIEILHKIKTNKC